MSEGFRSVNVAASTGSGGGITSINGDTTAAQTFVAGTGISVSSIGGTTTITNVGSGSGGIASINADTTTAQIITGSNNISVSTLSGTTTVNGTLLAPKASPSFTGTIGTALTASRVVTTDGSSNLAVSAVTTTTLGFLDATSSVQTQLNGKQATGNYMTSLTGDGTASGPGAAAFTLATVNSNVGSFTSANITVNAKGLITAASNGSGGGGTPGGSANQAQFNNAGSFGGVPNSNFSDASGFVFPRSVTFSLPGPRVVQSDNTNWVILPWTGKITKAWIVAKGGPTGAAFIVDILKSTNNGSSFTSIWAVTPANRLQIAAAAVAGTQTSFDTSTFSAGDLLRIDITQVGSTVAGNDVSVELTTATQNT